MFMNCLYLVLYSTVFFLRPEPNWTQVGFDAAIWGTLLIHYGLAKRDSKFSVTFSNYHCGFMKLLIYEKAIALDASLTQLKIVSLSVQMINVMFSITAFCPKRFTISNMALSMIVSGKYISNMNEPLRYEHLIFSIFLSLCCYVQYRFAFEQQRRDRDLFKQQVQYKELNTVMYQIFKVFNDGMLLITDAKQPEIILTNQFALDMFGLSHEKSVENEKMEGNT